MLYVVTITLHSYMDEIMEREGEVKELVFINKHEAEVFYKTLKTIDYIHETDEEVYVNFTVRE